MIEELASDPRLGTPRIQVRDAESGEVLFDRDGDVPGCPASVLKILTSAAALAVLGPDYRVPTVVVAGRVPGEVVLVGGGDVTLTRLPSGTASFYTGAAHLDDLARQVRAALAADPAAADSATGGQPITSLVLDATLFSGPAWNPLWDEEEERVVDGCMSYITALQVDGDRDDPLADYTLRGTDPVGRVGEEFAALLGPGISISRGSAPDGARMLGQVFSQPVRSLIEQGLRSSDNVSMEMLARLVAIESGAGSSFDALEGAIIGALDGYGVPTTGIHIVDGSGLSSENAVPVSYLTRLLVKVAERRPLLGLLYDALPVSGENATGTLAGDRFTGENAIVGDAVHAKTGSITGAYGLAGILHARDGRTLTFAVLALGEVDVSARLAIDTLVTAFFLSGNYRTIGQ